jgi:anti-sigma factor (TIGR02949 family)
VRFGEDGTVDCAAFRRSVFALQAGEVAPARESALLRHVADCPTCSRRLDFERSMLESLRGAMRAAPAPPGLETRIRAALAREAPTPRGFGRHAWRWAAVAAASLLLALWILPGSGGELGFGWTRPQVIAGVERRALLVDHECDRAGREFEAQRRCTDPRHLNALKLPDGSYWLISPHDELSRDWLFRPDLRGREVSFRGDYYPRLETVRLTSLAISERELL